MPKVLVIGGSGVLGSAVVNTLRTKQIDFLIGSRNQIKKDSYATVNQETIFPWTRIDLVTGEGLAEALIGVDTVFHLASGPGKMGRESFEAVITRNLLKSVKKSDVRHLIYSSIVGVDKIPFSYYQAKAEAEELIRQSQIPYTILRATQFHDFIDFGISKLLSFPIGFVPGKLLAQPVHVDAVAMDLFKLGESGNQQATLNLGGPEVHDVNTLVQRWMTYRSVSKPIVPIPVIGGLMKRFARGYNTCPEKAVGSKTWEEYLRDTYGPLSA